MDQVACQLSVAPLVQGSEVIGSFLLVFGFTPAEAQYFIDTARFEDMELSYHVAPASLRAAQHAQKRLLRHLECLAEVRTTAYSLWKAHAIRTNKAMTTYAHVEDAVLRTYIKSLLARPTQRKARMVGFVSKNMVPFVPELRQAVYTHLRIEPVLGRQMLIKHGMDPPHGFDPGRVAGAIEDVFAQAGLSTPFVRSIEQVDQTGLSQCVRDTLQHYFAGEDLRELLTPSTRSRHSALLRDVGIAGYLRVTIGTPDDNDAFLAACPAAGTPIVPAAAASPPVASKEQRV